MSPITITDLNNAQLDVAHIAEIATSAASTAVDRLGVVKKTIAGVLAEIPDAGVVGKDTLANLSADLAHREGAIAYVTNDATSANNTTYRKIGAPGSGSWVPSDGGTATLLAQSAASQAKKASSVASVRQRPRGKESGSAPFVTGIGGSEIQLSATLKRPRSQLFGSGVVVVFGDTVVGQLQSSDEAAQLIRIEEDVASLTETVDGIAAKVSGVGGAGQAPVADWIAEVATVGGQTHVMIHDGATQRQITPVGSNWRAPVVRPFNTVRCLGDKGGSLARYDIAANGFVMKDEKILLQKVITGQSLSLGSRGYVLNPQGKYEFQAGVFGDLFTESIPLEMQAYCLSLAGGPRPIGWSGTTDFVPIREYADGVTGESISSSWAIAFKRWANQNLACAPRFLASISGVGATAYAGLKKGTTTYNNALSHVSTARSIALSKGWEHVVSSVSFIHGESQTSTTREQYAAYLSEWISDYRADIVAITGQSVPPMGFLSQTHTGETGVLPAITLAQLDAHEGNPNLCMVGPKYAYPYFDFYHMLAEGYVKIGEIEQRAERFALAGKKWQPLKPVSAVLVGLKLTITYNNAVYGNAYTAGPIGRLVLDTDTITDPGNYGYEIAGVTINAVALGASGNTVELTLSAAPAPGSTVDYALQATMNYPANGRRGNVRDSDTRDQSRFDGAHLYNWSVAHRTAITF